MLHAGIVDTQREPVSLIDRVAPHLGARARRLAGGGHFGPEGVIVVVCDCAMSASGRVVRGAWVSLEGSITIQINIAVRAVA